MDKEQTEKKIQVRFPVDVWQDLKQFSQEDQRSFNGEVIWILRNYIAERKGQKHDGHESL
ncbi:MAG TPA: hypothetical protein VHZ51_31535 [Ktedonobacteraceae bacterium]|jgi:hypothetical protein|nr:hypothetical protein [Ktedonobacteraceae bacterium]